MITQWDKAIVALIMAVLSLGTIWLNWDVAHVTEEGLLALFAILSPILVFVIPNRPREIARSRP